MARSIEAVWDSKREAGIKSWPRTKERITQAYSVLKGASAGLMNRFLKNTRELTRGAGAVAQFAADKFEKWQQEGKLTDAEVRSGKFDQKTVGIAEAPFEEVLKKIDRKPESKFPVGDVAYAADASSWRQKTEELPLSDAQLEQLMRDLEMAAGKIKTREAKRKKIDEAFLRLRQEAQ